MKKKAFTCLFFCVIPFLAFAQWSDNPNENTMINDSTGTQVVPMVVTNSSGESYISWYSATEGNRYDVFLLKLDKNGLKLWDEAGLLISNHATQSWYTTYDMILDKEENVVLVTQDQRTGYSNVFAYKISPEGQMLWGDDGIQLSASPGFDPSPKIALANNGDAVFMWPESPVDSLLNSSVFLKRVSSDGTVVWESNLADTAYDFMLPQLLHTENDDFIVSWMTKSNLPDTVFGQINWMHVFAQKIDAGGQPVWENNIQIDSGLIMPFESLYTTPYLTSDGNDGAYVLWQSFTPVGQGGVPTSYLNRLYNDGSIWKPNGYNVSQLAQDHHTEASMVYFEEMDNVMVAWLEYHYNGAELMDCFGIYGQLFNSDGQYLWDENGQEIIPLNCTMDTSYLVINLGKSTNNNAVIAYQKDYLNIVEPDTNLRSELYAVSVNQDGGHVWEPASVPLSLASSYKLHAFMGNLVDNQWVIAWEDNIENPEDTFTTGIYAQNLGVDGEIGPLGIIGYDQFTTNTLLNYPNPFQNQTTIEYELSQSGNINLSLMDVNGNVIKQLYSGSKSLGIHSIELSGSGLSSGIYIVKLQTGSKVVYHKIVKK